MSKTTQNEQEAGQPQVPADILILIQFLLNKFQPRRILQILSANKRCDCASQKVHYQLVQST